MEYENEYSLALLNVLMKRILEGKFKISAFRKTINSVQTVKYKKEQLSDHKAVATLF